MKIMHLLLISMLLVSFVTIAAAEDGKLTVIPAEHPFKGHNEPHNLRVFHTVRENHVQANGTIYVKHNDE